MVSKAQLYKYKGNKCACCGLSVVEMMSRYGTFNRMLEFNHINPSDKDPEYNNIIRQSLSTKQLDEVDKCVLLCRQCHGVLHAQNANAVLELTAKIDGQQATQILKGQAIIDMVDKHFTFLTNERLLLNPYVLAVGNSKPRLVFGVALETEGLFISLLKGLKETKKIKIFFWNTRKIAMEADHIKGRKVKLKHDVKFPIFNSECAFEKGDSPAIWVRNGFALTKEGELITSGTITYDMELIV